MFSLVLYVVELHAAPSTACVADMSEATITPTYPRA